MKEQKLALPEEGTKWPWEAPTFSYNGCFQATYHVNSQCGRYRTESPSTNQGLWGAVGEDHALVVSHPLHPPDLGQFHSLQTRSQCKEVSWFSFPLEPTETDRKIPKANKNSAAPKPCAPFYESMVFRFIKALQGTITSTSVTGRGAYASHHTMWMPLLLY